MIVSEARREANRRNSQRSTGPKSAEGKARVRANAIKHGMTAETVLDPIAFRTRADEWHAVLKPIHETEQWMADEVARVTLQLDHSNEVERTLRDEVVTRAEVSWDADRRLEVETLALGLSDRPGQVAAALQRTVHGCDFLIERWAMLAHVADQNGDWNEDQVEMAFDLLGTPVGLRVKNPCVRLDTDGRCLNPGETPAAFARLEVESLRSLRDHLEPLDDFHQSATAADLTDTPTPELRRFRRYQTALQNRLKWCLKQLETPKTATPPKPKPIAPPPPAPRPSKVEDEQDDDFDDEPSDAEMMAWFKAEAAKAGFTDADLAGPLSRRDQKLEKADRRREAKERKLERRRA